MRTERLAEIRERIKGYPDISWDIFWVGLVVIVMTAYLLIFHDWRGGEGGIAEKPQIVVTQRVEEGASATQAGAVLGAYVASVGGTTYHLPWCSGAKRIKAENRRWFQTKAEAESQGLRPAQNCKGM